MIVSFSFPRLNLLDEESNAIFVRCFFPTECQRDSPIPSLSIARRLTRWHPFHLTGHWMFPLGLLDLMIDVEHPSVRRLPCLPVVWQFVVRFLAHRLFDLKTNKQRNSSRSYFDRSYSHEEEVIILKASVNVCVCPF